MNELYRTEEPETPPTMPSALPFIQEVPSSLPTEEVSLAHPLHRRLDDAFKRFPEEVALQDSRGKKVTYAGLWQQIECLRAHFSATPSARIGLLFDGSIDSVATVVACVLANKTVVPLNPSFPVARLEQIIQQAQISAICTPGASMPVIEALWPEHERCDLRHEQASSAAGLALVTVPAETPETLENHYSYLLFTSGTTGKPKGIAISHDNLECYLAGWTQSAPLQPGDRCSATFALSFDLAMHDIFITLTQGACLCLASAMDLMFPASYIKRNGLTCWFSVPALANHMLQTRQLEPDSFPTLRLVLFCGEALPVAVAQRFASAAPNGAILNLYGPTEATIAFTAYRIPPKNHSDQNHWEGSDTNKSRHAGFVPIGNPFGAGKVLLRRLDVHDPRDPNYLVRGPGQGECILLGDAVCDGYWQDPDKTSQKFKRLGSNCMETVRGYLTGDIVTRDYRGQLNFVSRMDDQIKIGGHRVELRELEGALRTAVDHHVAYIVPCHQEGPNSYRQVVAVLPSTHKAAGDQIAARIKELLPSYMQPADYLYRDTFPTNSNGKLDRKQLSSWVRRQRPEH